MDTPRLGVAVSTVGRPAIAGLLTSLATGGTAPTAVVVADQSAGGTARGLAGDRAADAGWVPSSGGASRGRNDAVAALGEVGEVDVLAFPNDDCRYPHDTLTAVLERFRADPGLAALAVTLVDPAGPRLRLPADGTELDRRSVWRAIEPATFVRASVFAELRGFDERIGTGGPTPWQSGEITDLLLRALARGHRVVAAPGIEVRAPGEVRALDAARYRSKVRGYNRGAGHVYRTHRYGLATRLGFLVMPWVRLVQGRRLGASEIALTWQRGLGRLEGLLGRTVGRDGPDWLETRRPRAAPR
ncbi:hypothetical protein WHI96_17605 [Pseudonocardia tropica]|uniref:Glycosyl transferase family 2 n=1 Tax=Pseudonocardia tropica TaxID=681289 RepID=A0ABV1JZV0_9PSEU